MKRLVRAALGAAVALAALGPAEASASLTWSPAFLDFGTHRAGSRTTLATTLTLRCDTLPCTMTDGDSHEPQLAVTGRGFSQRSDCPFRLIVNLGQPAASCVLRVTFTPPKRGRFTGTVTAGPKGLEGEPMVALAGTGKPKKKKK